MLNTVFYNVKNAFLRIHEAGCALNENLSVDFAMDEVSFDKNIRAVRTIT
jgi:hypothetical protein